MRPPALSLTGRNIPIESSHLSLFPVSFCDKVVLAHRSGAFMLLTARICVLILAYLLFHAFEKVNIKNNKGKGGNKYDSKKTV